MTGVLLARLKKGMKLALRINLASGWYYVTALWNNRQAIYEDDQSRLLSDKYLQQICQRITSLMYFV